MGARILTSVLALLLVMSAIGSLGFLARPAIADSYGDFRYYLIDAGTHVRIDAYDGSSTDVTIPSGINGIPVTSIGDNAFYNSGVVSVTIPNGVTDIGNQVFSGCGSLVSVSMPDTVASVGWGVFQDCRSLTSVRLSSNLTGIETYSFDHCSSLMSLAMPDKVQSIGEYAFLYCTSLVTAPIGNGVQSIGFGAFSECSGLRNVLFPASVTSLGQSAFEACTSLTSVTIPSNLTSLGLYPFSQCSSLEQINVDPMNPAYCSINGVVYSKDASVLVECPCMVGITMSIPNGVTAISDGGFGYCTSLTNVQFPGGLETIGICSFLGCSGLTSLVFPASISSIGNYAFWMCSALSQITFNGDAPQVGYEWALDCSSNLTAYYPEGAYDFTTPTWNGINAYPMGGPGVPSSLAVEPGNSQVQLHWDIPLWDGGSAISEYHVYRSLSIDGPYSLIATTQQLNWTDGSRTNGLIYWYEVSAVNQLGEGAKTTAIAGRPCIEAPSLTAFSPMPNGTMDTAPTNIDVSISLGLPADNITSVNLTLDGTQLMTTVTNDVAHGVVSMNLSEGRHSVDVSVAFADLTKTASWTFTVLEGPVPVGFSWHNSTKGYSILVPDGWTVQDDATVGGNHTDTVIWGPISYGVHTNVIVKTGTDASITDTQEYLSKQVQAAINVLNQQGMNAVMTDAPQYVRISTYSAMVFGLDVSYSGVNMHQKAALIIDAEHSHYWIITCTESTEAQTQFNSTFSMIINGFVISSVPGLSSLDVFVLVAIVIVIGAILLVIVYVVLRHKGKRAIVPPPYPPIQGNTASPTETNSGQLPGGNQTQAPQQSSGQSFNYCPWCGAQTIGSQFCGNCGKEIGTKEMSPHDVFFDQLAQRISGHGFSVTRSVESDSYHFELVAVKDAIELTKFGKITRFIIAADLTPADATTVRDYSSKAFKYALANRDSLVPRGFGHMVMAVPVIVSDDFPEDLKRWMVKTRIDTHYGASEFPVLVSLKERRLYYLKKTPIFGAAYYRGYRKFVEQELVFN